MSGDYVIKEPSYTELVLSNISKASQVVVEMDSCQYEEVTSSKESVNSILKQSLITSVVAVQFFFSGLIIGAPTVIIPQLREEANGIDIDDEMASWLYSTSSFAMYPWVFLLPIACNQWGRKLPQVATSVCSVAAFAVLFFSQNPYHIIISEILIGFVFGGNVTYRILLIVDYTSPRLRGMFLAIKSASLYWGIWVANAIGTFYPWKYIAVLGFICSIYTFNALIWPESPYWLAKNGRYDECRASYQWLHGHNAKTDKEVHDIVLSAQSEKSKEVTFAEMFKSKEFYKPISVCVLMFVQYHFSGKLVCSVYILDIFKIVTKGKTAAYSAMLILDGVTVLGMYFGSYLSKIVKRRTLYFSTSFTAVLLLFITSLYLFLAKLSILESNSYIIIILLTIYSLSISCGPLILALSISGEVIPSKFQTSGYVIIGLTYCILYSWLLKLSPLIFSSFQIHGTFLFYGITCGICTTALYFCMPETSNKTKQEIDELFRDKKTTILEELKPL